MIQNYQHEDTSASGRYAERMEIADRIGERIRVCEAIIADEQDSSLQKNYKLQAATLRSVVALVLDRNEIHGSPF